jgi:hypothetical protein
VGRLCCLTSRLLKSDFLFGILQICIVMKFYEGSVGDKMACLRGGNHSLPDVLRWVGFGLDRKVCFYCVSV